MVGQDEEEISPCKLHLDQHAAYESYNRYFHFCLLIFCDIVINFTSPFAIYCIFRMHFHYSYFLEIILKRFFKREKIFSIYSCIYHFWLYSFMHFHLPEDFLFLLPTELSLTLLIIHVSWQCIWFAWNTFSLPSSMKVLFLWEKNFKFLFYSFHALKMTLRYHIYHSSYSDLHSFW